MRNQLSPTYQDLVRTITQLVSQWNQKRAAFFGQRWCLIQFAIHLHDSQWMPYWYTARSPSTHLVASSYGYVPCKILEISTVSAYVEICYCGPIQLAQLLLGVAPSTQQHSWFPAPGCFVQARGWIFHGSPGDGMFMRQSQWGVVVLVLYMGTVGWKYDAYCTYYFCQGTSTRNSFTGSYEMMRRCIGKDWS
jgi:hypothetical protein